MQLHPLSEWEMSGFYSRDRDKSRGVPPGSVPLNSLLPFSEEDSSYDLNEKNPPMPLPASGGPGYLLVISGYQSLPLSSWGLFLLPVKYMVYFE